MSGKGLAMFEERLAPKLADGTMKFDPAMIIMIITALIPLIQGCFNRKPAAMRRRLLNRARVASAIRRETNVSWDESFQLANACFDVADDARDDEIEAFISDCCS